MNSAARVLFNIVAALCAIRVDGLPPRTREPLAFGRQLQALTHVTPETDPPATATPARRCFHVAGSHRASTTEFWVRAESMSCEPLPDISGTAPMVVPNEHTVHQTQAAVWSLTKRLSFGRTQVSGDDVWTRRSLRVNTLLTYRAVNDTLTT
jgi:hypothetical protein